MDNNPLISVVMPVFKAERYVAEAIQSVLGQTYQPIELICVNDGSPDNSLAVLKSFGEKITLIDGKENGGIAVARNKGIRVAKGDYIAFMDDDDIWKPGKLSRQMEDFKKNLQLDISFTYSQFFVSPELPDEIKKLRPAPADPIAGYIAGTALIKMQSFKKVGDFNSQWNIGEFIDWLSRAKALGLSQSVVFETLHLRRIHENNTSVTHRSNRSDYLKVVKQALERKRQTQ